MSMQNIRDYSKERSFVLENSDLKNEAIVVYEVNLSIRNDVYKENKQWLFDHIKEMVDSNNFIKVNIYEQLNLDPIDDSFMRIQRLTARYYIKSYDELKQYLELRARNMRDQVAEKFGDKYTVSRRVFRLEKEMYFEN